MAQNNTESENAMTLIAMVIAMGTEFMGQVTEFCDGNGGLSIRMPQLYSATLISAALSR
jgi:hypothetical protein